MQKACIKHRKQKAYKQNYFVIKIRMNNNDQLFCLACWYDMIFYMYIICTYIFILQNRGFIPYVNRVRFFLSRVRTFVI